MAQYGDYSTSSRPPLRRHLPPASPSMMSPPAAPAGTRQPPAALPPTGQGRAAERPPQGTSPLPPNLRPAAAAAAPPRDEAGTATGSNPFQLPRYQTSVQGPIQGAERSPQGLPPGHPHPRQRPAIAMPPQPQPRPAQPQALQPDRLRRRPPANSPNHSAPNHSGSPGPQPAPRPWPPADGDRSATARGRHDRRSSRMNHNVTPLRRRPPAAPSLDRHPPTSRLRSRKPPKTPPMPVLYGIRLLILGIGVAAIAGTLLSALSPTNLSQADPSTSSGQSAEEATLVSAVRGQSRGITIGSIPLTTRLSRLETELENLSTLTPGLSQSTFMVDLDSGDYADLAGGEAVAAASTIKVPVLVAFLRAVDGGTLSLDQALVLQENQVAGGSGNLQAEPVGSRYTALEVATRMIVNSDNTATNMMIDLLGGAEALNQQFQTWGLTATVIRSPLPDLEGTNTTSARDLALLVALVDRGGLLSLRSQARMEAIMQRTRNRSLIPAGIGQGAIISNKTGDIATSLGDVALVDTPEGHRYVVATLIQRPNNDGRASELIRRIAERVNTEVNQPLTPMGTVKAIQSPALESGSGTAPAPGSAPGAPAGGYSGDTYTPETYSGDGPAFTTPAESAPTSPGSSDGRVPQG